MSLTIGCNRHCFDLHCCVRNCSCTCASSFAVAFFVEINERRDVTNEFQQNYLLVVLKSIVSLLLVRYINPTDYMQEMDWETIVAGLLHDTVEDTDHVTFERIEDQFGPAVRRIVEGETKASLSLIKNNFRLARDLLI